MRYALSLMRGIARRTPFRIRRSANCSAVASDYQKHATYRLIVSRGNPELVLGGRGWTERSEGSPEVSGWHPMALALTKSQGHCRLSLCESTYFRRAKGDNVSAIGLAPSNLGHPLINW